MAELAKRPDTKKIFQRRSSYVIRAAMNSLSSCSCSGKTEKSRTFLARLLDPEMAMLKFDAEYQFGKYARNNSVLPPKNVLRMVHPRPMDAAQSEISDVSVMMNLLFLTLGKQHFRWCR